MALPPTFVGFSSTDINYYRLMLAWKNNEHIDFDFRDCQLQSEIRSEDENYIKSKCRQRILMASKFVQLIGEDTRHKHKYVRWEAEVALEKGCTIIGVNLNGLKRFDSARCPGILNEIGAVFVPFNPKIIQHAVEKFSAGEKDNYFFKDALYQQLGI